MADTFSASGKGPKAFSWEKKKELWGKYCLVSHSRYGEKKGKRKADLRLTLRSSERGGKYRGPRDLIKDTTPPSKTIRPTRPRAEKRKNGTSFNAPPKRKKL